MAVTHLGDLPVNTVGDLPALGDSVTFSLTGRDLKDSTIDDYSGKKVLNFFPSVDTAICAMSVRTFNEKASSIDGVTVINISADLPFAFRRFCGAEGLDNVVTLSAFRSGFLDDIGLRQADGPMAGLSARAVIVVDESNKVLHVQLVPSIGTEPNYDAALAALG